MRFLVETDSIPAALSLQGIPGLTVQRLDDVKLKVPLARPLKAIERFVAEYCTVGDEVADERVSKAEFNRLFNKYLEMKGHDKKDVKRTSREMRRFVPCVGESVQRYKGRPCRCFTGIRLHLDAE